MSDELAEQVRPLDSDLVPDKIEARLGRDLDIAILPEFVAQTPEGPVAGFRETTQALRVDLSEAGVRVELAVPEGAAAKPYEEHAADWVLPVILAAPGDVASLLQVVLWIRGWASSHRDERISYREAVYDPGTGRFEVRAISGRGDRVADIIERRLNQSEPGNTSD